MNRDFDDFYDEFDCIRQQHSDGLDHDQYGDYYDPNSENYYDLDSFSLEYAKSLFFGLGSLARYKGFNLVGHKCAGGVTEGCSQDEYDRTQYLKEQLNQAYDGQSLNLFDDVEPSSPTDEEFELESELNKLGDRCLNGVCEPCTSKEFTEYISRSIGAEKDDPHDLYHLNNQTVLDPVDMPSFPVEPSSFVEKVVEQLTSHNVHISDQMPEVLEHLCRLFNFSIKPNSKLPRTVKNLVFPAQTGIGKSVSVQVYVSLLSEHSSIIVVSKVEEAIKYCESINRLAGDDNYARCYYSLTDKNSNHSLRVDADKLRSYRCIVITHNMFRRINIEQEKPSHDLGGVYQGSGSDKSSMRGISIAECYGAYNNGTRDFVCIDEKLSFFEQVKLDYSELNRLIDSIELALDQSKELKAVGTSHKALKAIKAFRDFVLFKDDKIVMSNDSISLKSLCAEARDVLSGMGEKITYSERFKFNGSPIRLVGLRDKDAVVSALRKSKIPLQARKRNVMGISASEVMKLPSIRPEDVEPYYYEKFDPVIANCLPREESESSLENSELDKLFDDPSFNGGLSDEQVEAFKRSALARNEQTGLELASSVIRTMLSIRVEELLSSLEALGAKKNSSYRRNTLDALNEQLDALRYFSKNDFLIYKTNVQKALLATENLVNHLGLSVVLDATANINEYYQVANRFLGHVALVKAPQIRNYQNLTIHKAVGFSQARSAIYKGKTSQDAQAIAKSYASYALNELGDGDKLLIICHKDFAGLLKKEVSDNRIEFTHWGNHVGRNDWSHCNKVMLIGWNYLPPIEHVSAISASLDSVLLTSRYLDDELLETFAISQLADDLVQGLMRSQARVISTNDSDCRPTSFYLFYKDDEKSKRVLELVESQFRGCSVVDWQPNGKELPKKKTKRNKNVDRVIQFLIEKSKSYETYLRSDLQADLNINKSTMGRLIDSEYMKDLLSENGFAFRNKDGKSQHFILR
ncbi:hypothetical protein [Marinomonas communis]|uniref:hypothetical protein n=1 Tax=Marinomonas communis TaxID=28254 RepID=UPI001D18F6E7|nr:hypothetical protein [Marinomonas communis]MCC4275996.1 hypothetical protein [Marinomonas communis]